MQTYKKAAGGGIPLFFVTAFLFTIFCYLVVMKQVLLMILIPALKLECLVVI